jgi:hypothetical protein
MDFLITSEGDWLVAGSKEAEARIGYEDPDFDLTAFAVRNLGFVQVTWTSPTKVRVRFHPDQVASGALLGLKGRQNTFGDASIEVDWLTSSWQSKQFTDAGAAIAHVDALASAATTLQPRYRATPLDIQRLSHAQAVPLKLMLQKWRVSFRRFGESVIPFAMQHGLFSRLAIVGVKQREPDPVFRFLGDGFAPLYGEAFVANAPGEKVENQPDKEYALWLRDFYRDVAIRKEPRYDVVDAVLPQAKRGPFLRYERLLLPWETPSGEIFVTVSSHTIGYGGAANDMPPPAAEEATPPPRERTRARVEAAASPQLPAPSTPRGP